MANEARSAELAIIISYPTSASGIIVLLKTIKKYCKLWLVSLSKNNLAPVVQRPDNFIQWISHYPTVSICAKISVFHRVQANMHTLSTV